MSDLERFMQRGVDGFDPSTEEGLEAAQRRVQRRQRRRQVLAGALTLTMFGGTLAGALLLGGPRGRPVAGPTLTPSPTALPSPGQAACYAFRKHRICLYPSSDVVAVGSGEIMQRPWSLLAWTATYVGPSPHNLSKPVEEVVPIREPMLCHYWRLEEDPSSWCVTDRWLIEGMFEDRSARAPELVIEVQEDGQVEGLEDLEGLTLSSWDPIPVLRGLTRPETARVEIRGEDGTREDALLFGPFGEFELDVRWFVAFLPSGTNLLSVTITAYDDEGNVLWVRPERE